MTLPWTLAADDDRLQRTTVELATFLARVSHQRRRRRGVERSTSELTSAQVYRHQVIYHRRRKENICTDNKVHCVEARIICDVLNQRGLTHFSSVFPK